MKNNTKAINQKGPEKRDQRTILMLPKSLRKKLEQASGSMNEVMIQALEQYFSK